jgi:hypothetical protein
MTDIYIERVNMTERLTEVLARVDDLDLALGARPSAPDGGIAAAMIGFIATAGGEAAGVMADVERLLAAVTVDVLDDLELTDAEVGEAMQDLTDELDG